MPFKRLFGSHRKSNKENVPQNLNTSTLDNSYVYTGVKTSQLVNPYSVITEPKKHKGPRSCPGAPMTDVKVRDLPFSDRHSQLNCSIRYENLPPRRRVESLVDYPPRRTHRPIREEDWRHDRSTNYESCDSDDDDFQHSDVQYWKMKCAAAEKVKGELENSKYELEKTKKELQWKLKTTRRYWEDEKFFYENKLRDYRHRLRLLKSENEKLRHEQQQSHNRIMELEEERVTLLERQDTRPLAVNSNGPETICGAGEALCDHNDPCNRDMVNSDTPSVSMFNDGHMESEHDEIRVFRPAESSDDDDLCRDDDGDFEVERSIRPSPLEVPISRSSPPLSKDRPKLARSLSDTNISAVAAEVVSNPVVSTLDRGQRSSRLKMIAEMKEVSIRDSQDFSSDEDDQMYHQRLYEKQLKKKGEVVKYQPPRCQVQPKHFRPKVGKPERNALSEFDYLRDLSSDAGGLSSPDVMKGYFRKA